MAKNFSGNQWDRFHGLETLLEGCAARSVLDVGMSDGLVAYEFARHGAAVIHGVDIDPERVAFAQRLFSAVPVESRFACMDCSCVDSLASFADSEYDYVLFLAVYQKIERKKPEALPALLAALAGLTRGRLAIRTPSPGGLSWLPEGFELELFSPARCQVGPLRILHRVR